MIPPATGNQSDESLRAASTTAVRETLKASCRRTMPSQRRIGLTGGIASGKSSVGRWLSDHGLPVLDADRYAREALAPGSAGCQAVLKRYGPAVAARGARADVVELNRSALADIVFADAVERQWLERLVHPLVRQAFDSAIPEKFDGSTEELVLAFISVMVEQFERHRDAIIQGMKFAEDGSITHGAVIFRSADREEAYRELHRQPKHGRVFRTAVAQIADEEQPAPFGMRGQRPVAAQGVA